MMESFSESLRVEAGAIWDAIFAHPFLAGLADRVTAITTMGETGADAALMDALPRAKIIASKRT